VSTKISPRDEEAAGILGAMTSIAKDAINLAYIYPSSGGASMFSFSRAWSRKFFFSSSPSSQGYPHALNSVVDVSYLFVCIEVE